MRVSFDHTLQPATIWESECIWLICTVELTETELTNLRQRNPDFSRSIGHFYIGHPSDKRNLRRPVIDDHGRLIERGTGFWSSALGYPAPLTLRFILSGKPICLRRSSPAEITEAEALVTDVFSELKALIEAPNPSALSKRTIEL
jgi:hypothetical protein